MGQFIKECPKNRYGTGNRSKRAQSSSVALPDKAAHRGATSITGGGENCLYAITSPQEQENYPDVVIGRSKSLLLMFILLDQGACLSFATPYVANHFEVLPEKL